METMSADGSARPAGGVLTAFEVPSGPGYRTDSFGYVGYRTSPQLRLAAGQGHRPHAFGPLTDALAKASRALSELRVEGVATNTSFLQSILSHPEVRAGRATTRFVDEHLPELVAMAGEQPRRYFTGGPPAVTSPMLAGVKVDGADPLAVLDYGRAVPSPPTSPPTASASDGPVDTSAVRSPLQGTVVQINVAAGDAVREGQQLLVMEAMKMEHVVAATTAGYVRLIGVSIGDAVFEGHPLVFVEAAHIGAWQRRPTRRPISTRSGPTSPRSSSATR